MNCHLLILESQLCKGRVIRKVMGGGGGGGWVIFGSSGFIFLADCLRKNFFLECNPLQEFFLKKICSFLAIKLA